MALQICSSLNEKDLNKLRTKSSTNKKFLTVFNKDKLLQSIYHLFTKAFISHTFECSLCAGFLICSLVTEGSVQNKTSHGNSTGKNRQ